MQLIISGTMILLIILFASGRRHRAKKMQLTLEEQKKLDIADQVAIMNETIFK